MNFTIIFYSSHKSRPAFYNKKVFFLDLSGRQSVQQGKKERIHSLCHFQSPVLTQSLSQSSSVITPKHDQLSFLLPS